MKQKMGREILRCPYDGTTNCKQVDIEVHGKFRYLVLECQICATLRNVREGMYKDEGEGIWAKV